jgi:ABC-2 type transport system permease protein
MSPAEQADRTDVDEEETVGTTQETAADEHGVSAAPGAAEWWTPRPGALARLVGAELRLVLGRRRNQVLVAGLSLMPLLLGLVLFFTQGDELGDQGPGFIAQVTQNGLFLVVAALFLSLPMLLPLTVAVASGDAVAGEASAGTLRYLLLIPVSRGRLLLAKAVGALVLVGAGVTAIAVSGLLTGAVLFGLHDVVLLTGTTVPLLDGIVRVVGAVVYIGLSLTGLVTVGLFLSTLTEVPIAAMAATAVVSIVSVVLDSLGALSAIHPYLLTHHWFDFAEFLRYQVDWGVLGQGMLVQGAWVLVFSTLAWGRITQSDISS